MPYPIHACAVMPDHVHLVIDNVERPIRNMISHLKAAASHRLAEKNLHPFQEMRLPGGRRPLVFAEGAWKTFLSTNNAVYEAIRYVIENPVKQGLQRQCWSFIVPFEPDVNAPALDRRRTWRD